jgi:hypothetical protein
MKKIIVTLALAAPFFGFAQEAPKTEANQNNNPFTAITTGNQVDQEYIDISQMTAVLNITNTQRSATRGAQMLVDIPREFIEISQLTEGLERVDNDKIKALLNK